MSGRMTLSRRGRTTGVSSASSRSSTRPAASAWRWWSVNHIRVERIWLTLGHLQPFAPPDPLHPFVVHRPAGRMQQCRHPAIAVAPVLPGQRDDVVRQRLLVICPTRHFALCRPMLAEHAAYPPLGHIQHRPHLVDAASAPCGAQKFPFAASCRISLSNVRSEIARRSRRFSFSRSFIRRA